MQQVLTRAGICGVLAIAGISLGTATRAHAVDPVPIMPASSPRTALEGTKRLITETNDYFYVDSSQPNPIFRVSFAAQGIKKRILVLHVAFTAFAYSATSLHVIPQINGVALQPTPDIQQDCTAIAQCVISADWSADLESYEAANPGVFDHKPIDVSVELHTDVSSDAADGSISIIAQVLKR